MKYGTNGQVGLQAVEAGLHVLLETPIAHELSEADAIIAAEERTSLKIEVAVETLTELVARTNPEITWRNPFRGYYMDDEMIAVADCVMSLVNTIRENRDPEYGPQQARLDQELVLAMQASAQSGGTPVHLPYHQL